MMLIMILVAAYIMIAAIVLAAFGLLIVRTRSNVEAVLEAEHWRLVRAQRVAVSAAGSAEHRAVGARNTG
jgi:hypothetical protein